jgi:hypothetical protein
MGFDRLVDDQDSSSPRTSFLENDWSRPIGGAMMEIDHHQQAAPLIFRSWVLVATFLGLFVTVVFSFFIAPMVGGGEYLAPADGEPSSVFLLLLALNAGVWCAVSVAATMSRRVRELVIDPNRMRYYHPVLFPVIAAVAGFVGFLALDAHGGW